MPPVNKQFTEDDYSKYFSFALRQVDVSLDNNKGTNFQVENCNIEHFSAY